MTLMSRPVLLLFSCLGRGLGWLRAVGGPRAGAGGRGLGGALFRPVGTRHAHGGALDPWRAGTDRAGSPGRPRGRGRRGNGGTHADALRLERAHLPGPSALGSRGSTSVHGNDTFGTAGGRGRGGGARHSCVEAEVTERLLTGQLPVRPEDLPELAKLLDAEHDPRVSRAPASIAERSGSRRPSGGAVVPSDPARRGSDRGVDAPRPHGHSLRGSGSAPSSKPRASRNVRASSTVPRHGLSPCPMSKVCA
jgi:hypothetical protein